MAFGLEDTTDRASVPPAYPAFATTGFDGFAVIDVETTGLSPQSDRVIEIAVVHVDPMGVETARWETLLNPGRDLGPQRVHGIRAADVLGAPTFGDVATELVGLLDGRVPVAHHAAFDSRFLFAELERSGIGIWSRPAFLCTMQLARHFLPGSGRSLGDCCAAYDIRPGGAHRALSDAAATGKLLAAYLADARRDPSLAVPFIGLAGSRWPSTATSARPAPLKPRPTLSAVPTASVFLGRLADRMPPTAVADADAIEYLALLDRALIDRALSVHEAAELQALAERHGIGRAVAEGLHREYFQALTRVAWEDGILTEAEIDELLAVSELLELPTSFIEQALDPQRAARIMFEPRPPDAPAGGFALAPGDAVVLTGEMARPRAEWEAELAAAGLAVGSGVTKRTRLLVAADPDTLSGKARKARDYGIPIASEHALPRLLDDLLA
jgi:DNA polymerase-3 subunit epsilon